MRSTDNLRLAGEAYNAEPVPENLGTVVDLAILEGTRTARGRRFGALKKICAAAAAAAATFVLLLNTNPAFAAVMGDVPVIGGLCRVVTFAKYDEAETYDHLRVRIPKISDTGDSELETRVNLEIRYRIDSEIEAARERAEEYYKAYIATGGDAAEFRPMEIYVDYEIKDLTEDAVSFVIYKEESLASVYGQIFCYNIDLESGRNLTLRDVLGDGYRALIRDAIDKRLAEDSELARYIYDADVDVDVDPLLGDDRMFYMKDGGRVAVVVFDKYEIAAGAAGRPEFEVPIP